MVPVARRNLFAEKGRFAISVAGVAFAVLLILIVLALYRGFSRSGQTFKEMPGDLWVVQQGTTDPFHSVSLVERSRLASLGGINGVAAVVPVLSRTMEFSVEGSSDTARVIALDVDPALPLDAGASARFLPPAGSIVIDDILHRKTGLAQGDAATFGSSAFTVDHVERGSNEAFTPFVFMNFEDASAVFGVAGIVNYGLIILAPAADPARVAAAVEAQDPALRAFTSDQFATAIRKEIDESFLPIITVLLTIGFVVGAAVVGLTIYTATIERSREFGVMKAVGSSAGFLYRIVLSQSAMLTACGFLLGLAGAWLVAQAVRGAVPDFVTDFRITDVLAVLGATIGMAIVASFVPARRINGIDPAIVFKA